MPSLHHVAKNYLDESLQDYIIQKQKSLPEESYKYYTKTFEKRQACVGDKRVQILNEALVQMDKEWKRSVQQRMFHKKAFEVACLPQLYGDELIAKMSELFEIYAITSIQSEVLVQAPRRFGKTIGTALFNAAWLWSQPNGPEISIFSTGRRASQSINVLIAQMLYLLAGKDTSRFKISNQETVQIINMHGTLATGKFYPAGTKVSKNGGKMIFYFIVIFIVTLLFINRFHKGHNTGLF